MIQLEVSLGMESKELKPFIKWVGGKRQLLDEISKYVPDNVDTYFEPFLGAGAVFFHLAPEKAVLNDINTDLIELYEIIRDNPRDLIKELGKHKRNNSKEYYYDVRNWDRSSGYHLRTKVSKAARFIYMNKVGYNGLYRVNSSGQYNVPYGKYVNPKILDESLIENVSKYLNSNKITFTSLDFEKTVETAKKGDLIYFDPPYDPLTPTASFTAYQKDGFNRDDQIRLKLCSDDLVRRGAKVILSNSNTTFINELYSNKNEGAKSDVEYYVVHLVDAKRNINSKGDRRGAIKEVLIVSKDA